MNKRALLHFAAISAVVGLLSAVGSACDPVSATQCAVDDDCVPILGVEPANAQCVAGICQKRTGTIKTDSGPTPQSCQSNDECTSRLGSASICRESACVALQNDVVTMVTDAYKGQKDAIVLGFVVPLTDPTGYPSAYDQTWVDGVRLALEDWNTGSGSGGGLLVGTERRPIIAAICDSKHDAVRVQACVDHLIGDLHVPAIVFRASDDTNAGYPLAVTAHTFAYCSDCEPLDVTPDATNSGLLWFGSPSVANQMPMRADWLEKVESKIRGGRAITDLKVMLLSTTDLNYGAAVKDSLRFNRHADGTPRSGSENEAQGTLKWRNLDIATADWHALGTEIVSFAPDVIVAADLGRYFHYYVVPEVEARWGKGPRPQYVASESESFDSSLAHTIGGNDELRRRMTGVWGAEASDAVIDNEEKFFEPAFQARFGKLPGGIATGFESVYALSFGMVAALNGAHTSSLGGGDVRDGMKRLVGGPPENVVDFKASDIQRGVTLLQQRQAIDARGVYTDLEWDPTSGLIQNGAGVWCPSRKPDGTIKAEEMWSYDSRNKPPEGDLDPSVCAY